MTPTRPLEGVLVVALEQAVAAPLATCRLADAGARVIKVERPGGDFARGYDAAALGESSYFTWINRGKESIVLDLEDESDRALMGRLISQADVFIQNLSVGASARLGFGAHDLIASHPALIVMDLSGYGEEGPYAKAKAYDLLVQAESGLLTVSGPPGPLGRVGVSVVDIGTGLNAALAIVEALYRRNRTGKGAHLRCSLFDSIAEWMTVPLLHFDYLGKAPDRIGLAHPSIAPYGAFETSEGSIILISIQSDREWVVFCENVLKLPSLAYDPKFQSNKDRVANRHEIDEIVRKSFASLGIKQLEDRLCSARIAFGHVNDVAALSDHPHLRRVNVQNERGTVALPAPPVRTDWETIRPVPALDQQGLAIRTEFAERIGGEPGLRQDSDC